MYKYLCENLIEIEGAIVNVEKDLRRYISTEQHAFAHRYTMILAYLVTCWSEIRILKLSHEPAFSSVESNSIKSQKTLEKKWVNALNISICRAYTVDISKDISNQLSAIPKHRYKVIVDLINNELVPSITIRNSCCAWSMEACVQ